MLFASGASRFGRAGIRLAIGVIMAGIVLAQAPATGGRTDRERDGDSKPEAAEVRKLESVSWNPGARELTWVVSKGTTQSETPVKNTYVIRVDEALMKFEGERRGFDPEEARSVQSLLNMLSRYAVVSTIWWEEGKGVKLDGRGSPGLRASGTPKSDERDRRGE